MDRVRFPGLLEHKLAHQEFIATLESEIQRQEKGERIGIELLRFLNDWLIKHIQNMDRQYAEYLAHYQSSWLSRQLQRILKLTMKAKSRRNNERRLIVQGLNMQQAIAIHVAWRDRLQDLLQGISTENLEADKVRLTDLCLLGNWLKTNEAHGFADVPEFQALLVSHKSFHDGAADIVTAYKEGDLERAQHLWRQDLRHHSSQLRFDLIRLYGAFS